MVSFNNVDYAHLFAYEQHVQHAVQPRGIHYNHLLSCGGVRPGQYDEERSANEKQIFSSVDLILGGIASEKINQAGQLLDVCTPEYHLYQEKA